MSITLFGLYRLPRYTSQGIVYKLQVAKRALQDIEEIYSRDRVGAARIRAILQEVNGSQRLLGALTSRDFGLAKDEKFHVSAWQAQQKQGRNLWRMKVWDLEAQHLRYRIVYALDPRNSCHYVLAVLEREFDYDDTHPRVRELLELYDRLDIPPYR
jgi:hypothetical protein